MKAGRWSNLLLVLLVASGVCGREGIQVVFDFCKADSPMWEDDKYVDGFIEMFEVK